MTIPDGWQLVPKVPTVEMIEAIPHEATVEEEWSAMLAAAPPPPEDSEVAAGREAPGVAGATYRLLDRFDWRETAPWARGEMLRGTEPHLLFEVAAGCVASVVLQVAGLMTRSQMREAARAIMTKASLLLEEDIEKVIQAKKGQTALHNQIRLVVDR